MLRARDAVLVIIDVQNRLLSQIAEAEETLLHMTQLIRGFQILEAPILVTEQYRRGLGATHPAIQQYLCEPLPEHESTPPSLQMAADPQLVLPGFEPFEKVHFSCGAHGPFVDALTKMDRRQVVLAGIEAHVCVLQTALQLAGLGYEVFAASDAMSSRTVRNRELALRRMEQEGVRLTSTESAVFEMLEVSGTPEFKRWLEVIR